MSCFSHILCAETLNFRGLEQWEDLQMLVNQLINLAKGCKSCPSPAKKIWRLLLIPLSTLSLPSPSACLFLFSFSSSSKVYLSLSHVSYPFFSFLFYFSFTLSSRKRDILEWLENINFGVLRASYFYPPWIRRNLLSSSLSYLSISGKERWAT